MAIGLFALPSTHTETFPAPPRVRRDLAYVARPLFLRLTEALTRVGELLFECRALHERATRHERAWGVPKLFFADRTAQSEWQAKSNSESEFPQPYLDIVAKAEPKLTEAREQLPDLLDDALALFAESIDVRRMARAIPGLREAARGVPQAAELAGILAMPDEQVWLVIHPAARTGYRITLEGVADIAQLHVILAEAITGDPSRGYLAGRRPAADALEACRGTLRTEGVVASARFQFYRPDALLADGTLSEGFDGSDHWYWGAESLADVPQEQGERILLIGEPVMPKTWEVTRRFSRIEARAEVLEVLPKAEVERWLQVRCPDLAARSERLARVA